MAGRDKGEKKSGQPGCVPVRQKGEKGRILRRPYVRKPAERKIKETLTWDAKVTEPVPSVREEKKKKGRVEETREGVNRAGVHRWTEGHCGIPKRRIDSQPKKKRGGEGEN